MSIEENIECIRKYIPQNVTLIAVSKTKSVEEIKKAYDVGIRNFGENKVQELLEKIDEEPSDIRWHLIGHLQTNKVKYVVGKVYLIHSLDSVKLLQEIEKQYSRENLTAHALIQINIGREESKTGIYLENLQGLLKCCEECKNVKVEGLMAIIPKGNEESSRKYFKAMKNIFLSLQDKTFRNISMKYLSMGMTGDYKIAISECSNMIRIGTGIFGARE